MSDSQVSLSRYSGRGAGQCPEGEGPGMLRGLPDEATPPGKDTHPLASPPSAQSQEPAPQPSAPQPSVPPLSAPRSAAPEPSVPLLSARRSPTPPSPDSPASPTGRP